MPVEVVERELRTPNNVINYAEVAEANPPIVLLHWASGRWQRWQSLLEPLSDLGHIYAPDARGHGKSGRTPGQYRFIDHASDAETLLREMVREPAVLIGHSLGGMQAAIVAAQSPDLVRSAMLVEPSLFVPERGLDSRSQQGFSRQRDNAGRKLEEYPESMPRPQATSLSMLDPEALEPVAGWERW